MKLCRRCRVSGRVQGVFYRATTRQKAIQYSISGWAKNLNDGSVEVLLCGEQSAVDAVAQWLWKGPPDAEITQVECHELAYTDHQTFVME